MTALYLHVPFCLRRCDYCDFTTFAGRDDMIGGYLRAVAREIDRVAGEREWPTFTSVFVGGGTPTYLPNGELRALLARLSDRFQLAADVEVSVEANPETVTAAKADELAAAGVNRVSLGAQSFAPRVLEVLGRWHDVEAPLRAVDLLRTAGIGRLSLDLIYGTPGESDSEWEASLGTALATGVTHLSAYALTVEANTPYAARARRNPALLPDDDAQARRMAVADRLLREAGLARYEISNWAVPGHECRHNLTYWRGGDWLAFGPGAHGHWQGRRCWNTRSLDRYVTADDPVAGSEELTTDQVRDERLLMGLRLAEGVPRHQVEPLDDSTLARLSDAGLLDTAPDRLWLTSDGMTVADAVILALA